VLCCDIDGESRHFAGAGFVEIAEAVQAVATPGNIEIDVKVTVYEQCLAAAFMT
jgi:hypothetical protein